MFTCQCCQTILQKTTVYYFQKSKFEQNYIIKYNKYNTVKKRDDQLPQAHFKVHFLTPQFDFPHRFRFMFKRLENYN